MQLTEWSWGDPGAVPTVQPGDIRVAFEVLEPLKQRVPPGIVGVPGLADRFDPSYKHSAVMMRTGILMTALEKGWLARPEGERWDAVFEVAATYPLTFEEDKLLDPSGFLAALGTAGIDSK
jgi:hypothetical protein